MMMRTMIARMMMTRMMMTRMMMTRMMMTKMMMTRMIMMMRMMMTWMMRRMMMTKRMMTRMMMMRMTAHKSGQSVKSFRLEVASVWHSNINSLSSSIKSFRYCGIIKLGTWVRSDRCCCNEYSCVHHYQYCGTPL